MGVGCGDGDNVGVRVGGGVGTSVGGAVGTSVGGGPWVGGGDGRRALGDGVGLPVTTNDSDRALKLAVHHTCSVTFNLIVPVAGSESASHVGRSADDEI